MKYDLTYIKERIKINPDTQCWDWQKSFSDGYGQFTAINEDKTKTSHRCHKFVYELFNGTVDEGYVVRHKCRNRRCCNPNHLILGTPAENNQDSLDLYKKAGERKRGVVTHNAKQVTIGGIEYQSILAASKALKVNWKTAERMWAGSLTGHKH